jgi:hypothetical protein
MSMALVTKGRLYPKAVGGQPIIIIRRDHFMDIHAEIEDRIVVDVDMTHAEEVGAQVEFSSDEITTSIEVVENVGSDVAVSGDINGSIQEC